MSEDKQRKIAYFEIVLLIDKSAIRACAREGKDFSKSPKHSRAFLLTITAQHYVNEFSWMAKTKLS